MWFVTSADYQTGSAADSAGGFFHVPGFVAGFGFVLTGDGLRIPPFLGIPISNLSISKDLRRFTPALQLGGTQTMKQPNLFRPKLPQRRTGEMLPHLLTHPLLAFLRLGCASRPAPRGRERATTRPGAGRVLRHRTPTFSLPSHRRGAGSCSNRGSGLAASKSATAAAPARWPRSDASELLFPVRRTSS
jgi:hypothetical protein